MATPAEAREFCGARAPGVVCLSDPQQAAFRAFRIGRAGALEVFAPSVFVAGARAALEGHFAGAPSGDPLQLGATFVIGAGGRVRLAYYSRTVADHPSSAVLFAALP